MIEPLPTVSAQVEIQPISLRRTFALQSLGAYDPTASLDDGRFSKSFMAATGVCVATVTEIQGGVDLSCQGPDAEQTLEQWISFFRIDDGYNSFVSEHPLLKRLRKDQPGLRLLRVPWLFDVACGAILQQRVRFVDAVRDWRHIVQRHGTRTPSGAIAFPSPSVLAALPSFELESMGIDAKRSRALIALAREIRMNPLRPHMTFAQLRARLGRVPGVGPWTVETTLGFGAGDSDALPPGDLYLPHLVTYALTGEPEGTDDRMMELLEPYRGHRFRVARLLYGAHINVPRDPSRRKRR